MVRRTDPLGILCVFPEALRYKAIYSQLGTVYPGLVVQHYLSVQQSHILVPAAVATSGPGDAVAT